MHRSNYAAFLQARAAPTTPPSFALVDFAVAIRAELLSNPVLGPQTRSWLLRHAGSEGNRRAQSRAADSHEGGRRASKGQESGLS